MSINKIVVDIKNNFDSCGDNIWLDSCDEYEIDIRETDEDNIDIDDPGRYVEVNLYIEFNIHNNWEYQITVGEEANNDYYYRITGNGLESFIKALNRPIPISDNKEGRWQIPKMLSKLLSSYISK